MPSQRLEAQPGRYPVIGTHDDGHGGEHVLQDGLVVLQVAAIFHAQLGEGTTAHDSDHLDRMQAHYRRTRERLDALAESHGDSGPIHPQLTATVLDKVAADDAAFTADVGTPTLWAARYLRMNGRRRLLGSFNHGTMADALPLS